MVMKLTKYEESLRTGPRRRRSAVPIERRSRRRADLSFSGSPGRPVSPETVYPGREASSPTRLTKLFLFLSPDKLDMPQANRREPYGSETSPGRSL